MISKILLAIAIVIVGAGQGLPAVAQDEDGLLFTPEGFHRPGRPAVAEGPNAGVISLLVIDENGRPTPCRANVVGPDGHFYQPPEGPLSTFSLTGQWPDKGKGNRVGKGPFRYYGRFFYTTGTAIVTVPAGRARVEVWKGLEYRPAIKTVEIKPGETATVRLQLERSADLGALGYDSGDPHLHLLRRNEAEEKLIFDLLDAEDVRYGMPLTYNEPAGPYSGDRKTLDYPQLLGLGKASERRRGKARIMSGQEYRSRTFGHLNLFLRDDLVNEGQSYDLDSRPSYGRVGLETIRRGGYAFYAHGGYAQAIYADFAKGAVSGVELLQFGEYRGIGLTDWYNILNVGYRFPIVGASDYPACRKLADCVTYAYQGPELTGDSRGWMKAAAEGRSFVTTGPLLLLEVGGQRPGAVIENAEPSKLVARVRVLSNVAPVMTVQVIVNGRVIDERSVPEGERLGSWFEMSTTVEVGRPSWVAARAYGTAKSGQPDAETHTNPIYINLRGKAPFDRQSLDALVDKLDGQMAVQRARSFPDKAKILEDFQSSRDILMKVRAAGGLPSAGLPPEWLAEDASASFDPSLKAHDEKTLAEYLAPAPPKSVAESLKGFETAGPFELQPVASEPLLRSPVAGAFDDNGGLYVCEMTDYPYKPKPGGRPLGSIRFLRDTDGDGDFDESHVFADGLLWAAGVAPWKGGAFVASPPDIWYMKDTDGDHKADLKRKVFTGFGAGNEQGMLNNLTFALDHRIYGSTSVNGGLVRHADRPDGPAYSVDGKDFRFHPFEESFEPLSGTVQFGTTFDDFGNRFLCSESRPLLHAVLPAEALARNPYLPVATALDDVAGHPVPIFRLSQPERWRQIRSARRIAHGERAATSAGASHHVIDAAAGVIVYRGSAYPPEYYGNVFVNDAQNNLIHRMTLRQEGASFKAARTDQATEFIRSYDNGFRPVNLLNAPDGTLYVLDMARDVIEAIHIPLDVVKHLDLRRGRDLGRIYRIAPNGFRPKPPPRLGAATTQQLVATLDHPDGWWRDTAHRLLFERQDATALVPLRALAREGSRPAGRVAALWSLQGLNALTDEDLKTAMSDPDANVAEQAVKLSGPRLAGSEALLDAVAPFARSTSARLRFAAAIALGNASGPKVTDSLSEVVRVSVDDKWTTTAVLAASSSLSDRLFEGLARDRSFAETAGGATTLRTLAGVVGARNQAAEVSRVVDALFETAIPERTRRSILLGLGRGLQGVGATLRADGPSARHLEVATREAVGEALSAQASVSTRLEAVELLGFVSTEVSRGALASLLEPAAPGAIQVAAIKALAGTNDPNLPDLLLERSRRITPAARAASVDVLLSRPNWTLTLLKAAKGGRADVSLIDQARRDRLESHKDGEISELAIELFGKGGALRPAESLAAFAPALAVSGDKERGRAVFEKHCLACHKVEGKGHDVGPDLTATQFVEPLSFMTHVLEPNRYVAPNYVEYVLSDRSGRVFNGMIVSEGTSSVTLKRSEGAEDTILRSQIEEMTSTGKSLMPEDFGAKLSPGEAADLVAYVLGSRAAAPSDGKLDVGTLPGLVEPDSP